MKIGDRVALRLNCYPLSRINIINRRAAVVESRPGPCDFPDFLPSDDLLVIEWEDSHNRVLIAKSRLILDSETHLEVLE